MIVATAGHIDHGKTTLIRALTGVDTDRLPDEKARGISIDLGFAHTTLAGGETIGFVDVPGHERFVRNMLSGVYAVDHVLLVVAADDGVMPQTREHLYIVELLAVGVGTVVITKSDRVPAERIEAVEAEVRELLAGTSLADAPVLTVSAVSGEGMDALRHRLAQAQHAHAQARQQQPDDLLTRFVVDRVFTVQGSGTVATGTVISGAISQGDALVISPAGNEARVRKLQRHGQGVARTQAGERCAINLANVEHTALARGDWLVAPRAHQPSSFIDVNVKVLASEAAALKHWTPVHVHIGAADIPGRLALRRGASIAPGAQAIAQLRLDRPVNAARGDRLILRDQSASRTIAGGAVIDPHPYPKRIRAHRAMVIDALQQADAATAMRVLLGTGERRVDLNWFERTFNWPQGRADSVFPADAVRVGRVAFDARWLDELHERILQRLRQFHDEKAATTGIEIAELQRTLALGVEPQAFSALVKSLASRGRFEMVNLRLKLAGHDSTNNPRDALAWQLIRPILEDSAAAIPSVRELSGRVSLSLLPLRDLMHRKAATGELVKLTPERFVLPQTLDMLARKAHDTASRQPGGLFTAAQYRDAVGTGRGLAIEILVCLDKRGVTRRCGENGRCIIFS